MKQILAFALLFLVTSWAAFGQCTDADRKKLEEFDRAWGDAGLRGDSAFLSNVLANDFMNVSILGTQTKAQTIDNQVKQAAENKANPQNVAKTSHDYYVITCTPVTATITHRNIITTKTEGKDRTDYTRSVHFLEMRGGRWQVVSSTVHPLQDAGILMYMEQEWNDADMKHDSAWFERNFAQDYMGVDSRTGAIMNKMEDMKDMKTSKRIMQSEELSDLRVRLDGNAAVVTGINHVKGQDDKGVAFDRKVSFTDTYIKREGRWLVWSTQGTDVKK